MPVAGVVVPIINHSSTSAPATPRACDGCRRLSRDEPAATLPSSNAIPGMPDTGGAVLLAVSVVVVVVVVVVRAGVLDPCAPLPFEDVALDPPPLRLEVLIG